MALLGDCAEVESIWVSRCNRRPKKIYAEQRLKAEIVQEARAKVVKPSRRKEMAQQTVATTKISVRAACRAFNINETCYRLLNVIDDYRREGLAIEAGFSLPSMRVLRCLNQLLE